MIILLFILFLNYLYKIFEIIFWNVFIKNVKQIEFVTQNS